MALNLHPDNNTFPGAAGAFHMILEAKAMLTDNEKRRLYDIRCNAKVSGNWNNGISSFQNNYGSKEKEKVLNKPRSTRSPKKNDGKGKAVLGDDEEEIVPTVKKSKSCSVRKADLGDDEVEIVPTVRKPESCGVTKGKRTAKSAPKSKQQDGKRLKSPGIAPNSNTNLDYSDGKFNDFDKLERSKKIFKEGQIWAVYDTLDRMPRFYALIDKVVSEDFKLQITWLEPLPNNEDEKKWLYEGLPASFGKLKLGQSDTIEDHAIFSHLVMGWKKSENPSNVYEIYPRKGETWALFKNWEIDWFKVPDRHKMFEFELVEILSDYCGQFGVTVAFLSKMNGFYSSFSRIKGKGVDCEVIEAKNRLRFSHKIPSCQVIMSDGSIGVKNFFELDPPSLPRNIRSMI